MTNRYKANIFFTVRDTNTTVCCFVEGAKWMFNSNISLGLASLAEKICQLTGAISSDDSKIWGTLPNPFEPHNDFAKKKFKECLE